MASEVMRAGGANQDAILAEFRRIPGVGGSIALDLWNLGLRSVADLRGRDPETLYARICAHAGAPVDRCMLYVFRCAVYFASTERPDPERLKWWNWSDKKLAAQPGAAAPTS